MFDPWFLRIARSFDAEAEVRKVVSAAD